MAGQTLTGFDAALKDVYGPRIEEQLSILNVLSDWIDENDSAEWTGRTVTYPIHVSRNQGVGATTEGSKLPPAGAQGYATVKISEKFNYGRIMLTGQVIKSSLQNKGAFTRAMESEIKGLVRDLSNDRERQFFGAGDGVLCLVNAAQTSTSNSTFYVDSPFGVTPTTNGARFLNSGMSIAAVGTSGTSVTGTFTVGNTLSTTGSYFIASAVTATTTFSDNERLVRYNSDVTAGTTNNLNNEVMGLLGIIDDGTYANTLSNINRTTYPIFKSTVISSVGTLSLDVIQRGIDATDELGGGNFATDGVFFCHHSVRREYLKLLQADRRYTGAELMAPDGGTKQAALKKGGEITYGNRPWRVAKHCPYGTLFGMLKGSVVRYIHVRGEWADEDERIFRNVAGYDAWEAFYRIFDNLHSDRPNECFRLDGITATVSISHIY
jgi:hypothetical protein